MDTSDSSISSSTTEIVNPSDGIQSKLTVATRSKRGRKQKILTEQSMRTTDQIQEIATQDTTTQKTTTMVIEQLPPVAAMTSTSSTQQIPRPKRGRKPKNSSPEQPVGTESETLQIQETATQDKEITTQETTTQETTITVIEQLPPDAAIASSTQQIPRPKRGRKPKNSSPEQPVDTESETLQTRETATQDKETATQETTTAVIEQLPPDVAMISTSSTQQIPRPKRGRKPKNSSPDQPVGTESETHQIRETATQDKESATRETTTAVIEQLPPVAAMTSTSSTQQIPRPKRGRKPKNSSPEQPVGTESETLQIQETATQDKEITTQETTTQETTTQETTITVIEQLPPDAAIASSTQQIPRPKRGRKPKNSSPEQPVETESETLQTRETATQDKETTTQETTTVVIEQFPDAMTSTSSTQQISRPKRGRKPKNSSHEQQVETEFETLQIQEAVTQDKESTSQESTITVIEQLLPDVAMTSTSSTQQISRPKRGRKPKNFSPEQPVGIESETLRIRETATQDKETATRETTTAVIEQLPPDVTMISTSSTQQISRPKRGRKPKNSSPEQPVGTESETHQIRETATQDKETATRETTNAVIEQLPPDVAMISTSSTQQISRPKRGRKPKNSSPEQPVETESETLQIQETATQDKESTTQETTITVIEQLLPDAAIASTSSTQQIPRPKRGRKPKNSSLDQPVGTEYEILEQVTSINEQPAGVEEQLQSSIPVVSIPKRERKLNEITAQITEEPTNVESTSASTTSQRGRKRKTVSESSTTVDQMASNDPKTDEEISEGNPPKRGRINVSEQELAEPVEVPSTTTTEATKNRGKKRKTTTENDNGERETGPAKENKKAKKSKKPEEKRLARTRTICSTPIYERIIRAEQQRIYMVNRTKIEDLHEEFAVLGSTGNIYTVTIKHIPNCTCPDFKKGNLCKHIFFVYLKVFRLNRDSSFIYQKALLSKELRTIFANAAPDPTALANQSVRDKYKTFTSGELVSDTNDNENENEKRRPIEGNCPICYEPLEEKDHKNIVWCKEGCGNNLHKDCFEQWKRSKRGDKVTCVYCRINWEESGSELLINEEGYVNLGDVQGMNTNRDTTSYYRNYRSWY